MSEFNEPWQFGPHSGPLPNFRLFGGIGDGIKDIYLGVGSVDSAERTLETMHRICACVNALAGVPTEVLQRTNQPFATASWIIANAPETRDFARSLGHPDCEHRSGNEVAPK